MTTANIEMLLILLIVIGAVGVLARILRIPYTPFLVLTGTVASLWGIFPLPVIVCFLFAALLSATDPVAVLDTLKHTTIN